MTSPSAVTSCPTAYRVSLDVFSFNGLPSSVHVTNGAGLPAAVHERETLEPLVANSSASKRRNMCGLAAVHEPIETIV